MGISRKNIPKAIDMTPTVLVTGPIITITAHRGSETYCYSAPLSQERSERSAQIIAAKKDFKHLSSGIIEDDGKESPDLGYRGT
jgi:hypothetical protein